MNKKPYFIFATALVFGVVAWHYINYEHSLSGSLAKITVVDHSQRQLEPVDHLDKQRVEGDSSAPVPQAEPSDNRKMNPQTAQNLIDEFFSKDSNISHRAKFCSEIIEQLCSEGYSSEAWEIIEQGRGTVRDWELAVFFRSADIPMETLLGKISSEDMRGETQKGFSGISQRYSLQEFATFIESPLAQSFLKDLSASGVEINMGTIFSAKLQQAMYKSTNQKQSSEVLNYAKELNSRGVLGTMDFMNLVNTFWKGDLFDKWTLVNGVKDSGENDAYVNHARSRMIDEMITADAPKTLDIIFFQRGNNLGADITAALDQWTNLDSDGVASWYRTHQASLNQEERSLICSSFAEIAMNVHEFENADLWIEQIQDPELRKKTQKLVEERMKSSLGHHK